MTREEAIKILADLTDNLFLHTWEEQYKALHMAIEALSTNAIQGEWILECDGGDECDNLYKCSICGVEYGCEEYDKPNFCPNCGTDMRNGM